MLRGGLRPWSQTMVSEGARPWGRGRSGACETTWAPAQQKTPQTPNDRMPKRGGVVHGAVSPHQPKASFKAEKIDNLARFFFLILRRKIDLPAYFLRLFLRLYLDNDKVILGTF